MARLKERAKKAAGKVTRTLGMEVREITSLIRQAGSGTKNKRR